MLVTDHLPAETESRRPSYSGSTRYRNVQTKNWSKSCQVFVATVKPENAYSPHKNGFDKRDLKRFLKTNDYEKCDGSGEV